MLGWRFEETFEETQWGKVKQMQKMRTCVSPSRQFEDTLNNTQQIKFKKKLFNVITQKVEQFLK